MDRRSFLRGAAVAPAVIALPATAGSAPTGFERISCERGDPGEIAYGMACADGKWIEVYLDGEPQRFALTADAREGWVKRHIVSPAGNIAYNPSTGESLTEIAHGVVDIKFI